MKLMEFGTSRSEPKGLNERKEEMIPEMLRAEQRGLFEAAGLEPILHGLGFTAEQTEPMARLTLEQQWAAIRRPEVVGQVIVLLVQDLKTVQLAAVAAVEEAVRFVDGLSSVCWELRRCALAGAQIEDSICERLEAINRREEAKWAKWATVGAARVVDALNGALSDPDGQTRSLLAAAMVYATNSARERVLSARDGEDKAGDARVAALIGGGQIAEAMKAVVPASVLEVSGPVFPVLCPPVGFVKKVRAN